MVWGNFQKRMHTKQESWKSISLWTKTVAGVACTKCSAMQTPAAEKALQMRNGGQMCSSKSSAEQCAVWHQAKERSQLKFMKEQGIPSQSCSSGRSGHPSTSIQPDTVSTEAPGHGIDAERAAYRWDYAFLISCSTLAQSQATCVSHC